MSKKYLVVKGHCGLGNRLHCLVGAIVYSELTGRKLIIDWNDGMYGKDDENSFPNLFSCKIAKTNIKDIIQSKSVYPSIWAGNLDKTFQQIKEHPDWIKLNKLKLPSCSLTEINYPYDVIVFTTHRHHLYQIPKELIKKSKYAGMSEFEIIKYVFENYIEVAPAVRERIETFKSKYFHHPVAGVHVRYTDLPVGRSNKKYHDSLQNLLDKYPNMTIFLATDNRDVLQGFQERYTNLYSLNKWYPKKIGKPMHYCCSPNDRLQMGIDALADMYLLSLCDYLIHCEYSSFSFYPLHITSMSQNHIIPIGTGDMFMHFYWTRKKVIRLKQRICCSLFNRKTLFKKSLNLL